jgi:hypothetical protein
VLAVGGITSENVRKVQDAAGGVLIESCSTTADVAQRDSTSCRVVSRRLVAVSRAIAGRGLVPVNPHSGCNAVRPVQELVPGNDTTPVSRHRQARLRVPPLQPPERLSRVGQRAHRLGPAGD